MWRPVDFAIGSTLIFSVGLAVARERNSADAVLADLGVLVLALHAIVGVLFIARREPLVQGTWRQRALCLLSVPMPALAFSLAPPLDGWPRLALVVFVVGAVGAAMSLVALGRCFGVLPAVRGVVVNGPFRLVRHPLYASELCMVLACLLAAADPVVAMTVLATVAMAVVRIRIEEDVMSRERQYGAYSRRVRFRLVPLLW